MAEWIKLYDENCFPVQTNQTVIFARLSCEPSLPCFACYADEWENALQDLRASAHPQAVVFRQDDLVHAFITLGDLIEARVTELFRAGHFIRAHLLNAMADELLYGMDKTLVPLLRQELLRSGAYIADRLEYGTDFQPAPDFVEVLHATLPQATLFPSGALKPLKSMLLAFQLSDHDCGATGLHDCSHCTQNTCPYRQQQTS